MMPKIIRQVRNDLFFNDLINYFALPEMSTDGPHTSSRPTSLGLSISQNWFAYYNSISAVDFIVSIARKGYRVQPDLTKASGSNRKCVSVFPIRIKP